MSDQPLLAVQDLRTYLFTRYGIVRAVDGVSFDLKDGETLGLVGESGSGKSMTALSIQRLLPKPAGKIVGGKILFEGQDLVQLSEREFAHWRGSKVALILQDPMTALNPVLSIGYQVGEGPHLHLRLKGSRLLGEVLRLLDLVHIPAARQRIREYPHQMSGGMRQRIVTAMAISAGPRLLIADEPTSALDVTTQVAVLELLKDLQRRLGLAMLLITHDFGIVNRTCDRVAVMYAGRLVEMGSLEQVMETPAHPYTIGLLSCVPRLQGATGRLTSIAGQPPDLRSPIPGCAFAPRCPRAKPICRMEPPPLVQVGPGHSASCWDL
jgi:oligopeptide/dipeptide ABC transporter ATP-binding protein